MTDSSRLDCSSAMRQLFDFLDGELTDDRMAAVRTHIHACRSCYPHYDFERLVLDTLGTLREEGAAPNELRARVMHALGREGLQVHEHE